MKVKNVLKNELALFGRGALKINPEKEICIAQQSGHQKHLDIPAVKTALRRKHHRANHGSRVCVTRVNSPERSFSDGAIFLAKSCYTPPMNPDEANIGNAVQKPSESATAPQPGAAPLAAKPLSSEEQMALYEDSLKETDWGHQPC
jgi:hypothetical protein